MVLFLRGRVWFERTFAVGLTLLLLWFGLRRGRLVGSSMLLGVCFPRESCAGERTLADFKMTAVPRLLVRHEDYQMHDRPGTYESISSMGMNDHHVFSKVYVSGLII